MTKSFDFFDYNEAAHIIEVSILNIKKSTYLDDLKNYHLKISSLKDGEPIPPPPSQDAYIEQNVVVLNSFKGKNQQVHKLRVFGRGSSCFWQPEVNEKYILYLGDTENDGRFEFFVVNGCQRRIPQNFDNYLPEKDALLKLKDSQNKKFQLYQHGLTSESSNEYLAFKGEYKNQKIHGEWVIMNPITHSMDTDFLNMRFFKLTFKNGKLIKLVGLKPDELIALKERDSSLSYFYTSWKANLELNYR